MPLPLTVSCFNKIQIGFTFLVLAHLRSPGKGPLNGCVCVCKSLDFKQVDYLEHNVNMKRLSSVMLFSCQQICIFVVAPVCDMAVT